MNLNEKQSYALEQVARGKNLFITGPGGVGKSVLIHKIKDLFGDSTVFLAPTGIAAQNIKGATIHRTFKFPIGFLGVGARKRVSEKAQSLFESDTIKRIVIDEISMVRADLFTAIDHNLRRIKKVNKPFGGVQIVLVGDFYQLSPVLNNRSPEAQYFNAEFSSVFAFSTESWQQAGLQTIMLDEVMRQSDVDFISALNSIRTRDSEYSSKLDYLNKIGNKSVDVDEPLFLCSTNKDAETINAHHYDDLAGDDHVYHGIVDGNFKDFPVPEHLTLKVGCKILVCANSQGDSEFYNGQTGYVTVLEDKYILAKLDGVHDEVKIEHNLWEEFEYSVVGDDLNADVVGSFRQFPVKLGYAVTIHKSQGLSLDNAVIYTGRGCFAHGQAYVALSRLRSLEGLHMMKPIGLDEVIVNSEVKKFYEDNKYSNLMNA